MITISIQGLTNLQKHLSALPRQVEIATQRAILATAKEVMSAEVVEMQRVFDRPTRFTLDALTTKINKKAMSASVETKDGYWTRSDNYLAVQREGGGRKMKAFENALRKVGVLPAGWMAAPGKGAALDSFGNMSVGQIRQILSWFDAAQMVLGSTQNMGDKGRDKKRKGTKKSVAFEYFSAQPGQRTGKGSWKNGRTQTLTPGIYKRTFFGFGSAIKPILIFVRTASYAKRFKFYEVARKVVDTEFQKKFDAALSAQVPKTL